MITLAEPRDGQSAPPASEPAIILVVDDDAPIRMLLDYYLTSFGYRVLLAGDGETAVQIARDHLAIDLAIIDVVMSGLCGQKLADELTSVRPKAAILFSSGHPASTMSSHGIDLQRAHFVGKPCPPDELKRKLAEMLATR